MPLCIFNILYQLSTALKFYGSQDRLKLNLLSICIQFIKKMQFIFKNEKKKLYYNLKETFSRVSARMKTYFLQFSSTLIHVKTVYVHVMFLAHGPSS